MCRFKSAIILKNKVVLAPEGNESHSNLLNSLNIEDNNMNAMKVFVRAELIPKDGNKTTSIDEWIYKVDQDITPNWYDEDPKRYENEFRESVKTYMEEYIKNKNIVTIDNKFWIPIKRDGNRVYYLMDGYIEKYIFGTNNNYKDSYIRENLNNSDLAKNLKDRFRDKLVSIKTNLLSLDGLDDYGTIDGDILAIPTIALYRECRKNITNLDTWWWLATPNSTPSGYSSDDVQYVYSNGGVDCSWYSGCKAVRPFFILEVND